jgi:hypothetical protein
VWSRAQRRKFCRGASVERWDEPYKTHRQAHIEADLLVLCRVRMEIVTSCMVTSMFSYDGDVDYYFTTGLKLITHT